MRLHKVYYSVFALKDGTVLVACPTRKPPQKRGSRGPRIEEEGICKWFPEKWERLDQMSDRQWTAFQSVVATCLNTKRIIRTRVESRFDVLDQKLNEVQEELGNLESKLDRLLVDPHAKTAE
jgi:hypothetical protein